MINNQKELQTKFTVLIHNKRGDDRIYLIIEIIKTIKNNENSDNNQKK